MLPLLPSTFNLPTDIEIAMPMPSTVLPRKSNIPKPSKTGTTGMTSKVPNTEKTQEVLKTKKKKTIPVPDQEAMERHIRLLHGTDPFTYQVIVKKEPCSVTPCWKSVIRVRDSVVEKLAELTAAGAEVCIVPNVMDGEGRRTVNCTGINWLFADCDAGHNMLESLLALPIKPNFVVSTSPRHFHPYWKVKGCSVDQFKAVQDAIARKLGEDPAVSDPSRCMRLAGTLNHKRGEPVQARIVYPAAGKTVDKVHQLAEFCAAMGLTMDAPAKTRKSDSVDSKSADTTTTSDSGVLSLDSVHKMLARIDPSERDTWLKVGKALHSRWPDAEGYELWATWSKRSEKYDADDQQRTWDKFKTGAGVTLGTLAHLAGSKARKWDERGFSDAFVMAAVGTLGFDPKTRMWWRFNGVRWESSRGDHQALKFARDFVNGLADEVDQELIEWVG